MSWWNLLPVGAALLFVLVAQWIHTSNMKEDDNEHE